MKAFTNVLNSICRTHCFSARCLSCQRPGGSGSDKAHHAFRFQARAVMTMYAQLLTRLSTVGDLIVIRGQDENKKTIPVTLTSEIVLGPDKRPRWKKGGEARTFTSGQLWWSRHDPDFKELLDTRGKHDVESPLGEWTKVECLCDGKRITVIVNGTTVNECYDVYPAAGKILLQCEGFELFVRKFELRPLRQNSEK